MERRRPDGGGELPLGGTRPHESGHQLPARPGYLSERKIRLQLRMAYRLGCLSESPARRRRPAYGISREVSRVGQLRRRPLLPWPHPPPPRHFPPPAQLLHPSLPTL